MHLGVDSFVSSVTDPTTGHVVGPAERMEHLLEEISLADRVGLHSFGIGEHHRSEYYDSAPPVILAAAAALQAVVAERAVVLLSNDGTLPLAPQAKVALVGPQADATHAVMGCYSFPLHVGAQHPDVDMGLRVDTLVDAFRALGDREVVHAQGCPVLGGDDEDIAAAAAFLCSDEASYITGQTLYVDGGAKLG